MLDVIPNSNQGSRNGAVLRLGLGDNVKAFDGKTKICGAKNSAFESYAFTYNPTEPNDPTDLQKRYQLADAIIFFCPDFFSGLADDSAVKSQSPMLDQLRTRGTQHNSFSRLDQSRLIVFS